MISQKNNNTAVPIPHPFSTQEENMGGEASKSHQSLSLERRDLESCLGAIVALDENNAIGRDGDLLCHLPNDLKHFKTITTGHTVVMGRHTYESLPKGALPNRVNIVITSDDAENYPNCIVVRSLEDAFEQAPDVKEIFIIGGGQLYRSSLNLIDTLYITRIHHTFEDADTFFPEIDFDEWNLLKKEEHKVDEKHRYDYTFLKYERKKIHNPTPSNGGTPLSLREE